MGSQVDTLNVHMLRQYIATLETPGQPDWLVSATLAESHAAVDSIQQLTVSLHTVTQLIDQS